MNDLITIGGFSNPSKMPCASHSIPAAACRTGAKLAAIPGSVCSGCYALKGCYGFRSTRDAMARRLAIVRKLETDSAVRGRWVAAFVRLLGRKRSDVFRWHDSGDLQGMWHLRCILEIASQLPSMRFWLPTKEVKLLTAYVRSGGTIPTNMTIRLSMPMIDQQAPAYHALEASGVRFSTVHTVHTPALGAKCPAPAQNGECRDCRRCWDRRVRTVSYHKH